MQAVTSATPTDPPSYSAVVTSNPRTQIHGSELPSFVLDGTLIFPSDPPSTAMYQLSGDPLVATSHSYELRRLRYKLTSDGAVRQSRTDVLYQILPSRTPHYLYIGGRTVVLLFGKAESRATYSEANMRPGLGSGKWKVPGHFRTSTRALNRLKGHCEVQWLDWNSGKLIALEKRSNTLNGTGKAKSLPRLEIKDDMEDRKRDLLVACWVAKLWRQAR